MKKSHLRLLISGALLLGVFEFFMNDTANILFDILMVAVPTAVTLRLGGNLSWQGVLLGVATVVVGVMFGTFLVILMCSTLSVPMSFGGMFSGVIFMVFVTLRFWRQ
jgi:hypothetical protein